jgi:hypothetical protein
VVSFGYTVRREAVRAIYVIPADRGRGVQLGMRRTFSETARRRRQGAGAAIGVPYRSWRTATSLNADRLAGMALVLLLVLMGAFLYRETRETTLWFDEWIFVQDRRGSDLDTFLQPHNQHLSLIPVALYKLLFATAGLGDYAPYRAVVIAAHLGCVLLLFVYARRRVDGFLALLAAVLLLFLGPAWQNILWPFQVAWLISLAAGLGALLMLDRGDRSGDVAACTLLTISLASSGLGLPIAFGLGVEVLFLRRRWRDAWIAAAPLALYALWWLGYQESDFMRHNVVATPGFVADSAAAAVGALVGLGGRAVPAGPGTLLDWGRPLVIALVGLLVWRLARVRPTPPRVPVLLTIALSFWILTALNRAQISAPYASRYLYVGALLITLLAVELGRGASLHLRAGLLLAAAVGAAALSNLGAFRDGGRFLRNQAQATTADLGALELAKPLVPPDLIVDGLPGYPFLIIRAKPYFEAVDDFGSPAATPAEIGTKPEPARRVADTQLIGIHEVGLESGDGASRAGETPVVDSVDGGRASERGGCVVFRRLRVNSTDARNELEVTVPSKGLVVTATGGPATVAVRRFADGFQPLGRLAASASATLRMAPDLAARPWHMRVNPTDRATVCALR